MCVDVCVYEGLEAVPFPVNGDSLKNRTHDTHRATSHLLGICVFVCVLENVPFCDHIAFLN